MNVHIDFTVGKLSYSRLTEIDLEMTSDLHGEGHVAVTAKDLETTGMELDAFRGHFQLHFLLGHITRS